MTTRDVTIRRARPDEAEALTALILRSKAYWGYNDTFMAAARPSLALSSEAIERDQPYCAEVAGALAGVLNLYALSADEVYLDDLFIEPGFIGKGIGALLWRYAVALAPAMGATTMVLDADPNARAFYEHMGAIHIGETPSTVVPGRTLPRMCYDLPRR